MTDRMYLPPALVALHPRCYGLWVTDDSLDEHGISRGDIIIIDPDLPPGEIVVAGVTGRVIASLEPVWAEPC